MMPMVLGFLFLFGSNGLYVATIEISNSSTCFLQHVTVVCETIICNVCVIYKCVKLYKCSDIC